PAKPAPTITTRCRPGESGNLLTSPWAGPGGQLVAPVAAALGARLAGGFFTGSIARAGAPSYPPVSRATGQYVARPGSVPFTCLGPGRDLPWRYRLSSGSVIRECPVYGELADQVVDARCGGHARTAGDGLPPVSFLVGDRLSHGEHQCEVFLRDHDEAAGVAADHIPGPDGHAAALHDDVDRTRSLVRSRRGMGAHGERRQPYGVETVEVTDGAVDDQAVAAEVGQSLTGDVADHRRVRPAAAVDDQHVAVSDQVRRLQHVQDVAGLSPHGHRRAAQLRAAGQVTQRRSHDRDR